MTKTDRLTITGLRARAVNVPFSRPHPTSSGTITSAPLVLVDLLTDQGVTGCSYAFCYTAIAMKPLAQLVLNLEAVIKGDPVAPAIIEQKLQKRFRLLGPVGLTGMAMAAIDMAAWDALAKACGMPLASLLGAEPRPIPAYHSLGMPALKDAAAEAQESAAAGFKAIKLKIGYPDVKTDLEVIRTVRRAIGDKIALMVDYNQSLSVPAAIDRIRALDGEGLTWIEEPTLADDFAGHARIAREAKTAIQIGENWWGPHDVARSIAAGASDYGMPDVGKIGGVSGWMRAVALAEAAGLPVSSHIFPEISTHLLAATPTCHWLEYQDWADAILQEPLRIKDGYAIPSAAPGAGLAWNEDAVRRFLVE